MPDSASWEAPPCGSEGKAARPVAVWGGTFGSIFSLGSKVLLQGIADPSRTLPRTIEPALLCISERSIVLTPKAWCGGQFASYQVSRPQSRRGKQQPWGNM